MPGKKKSWWERLKGISFLKASLIVVAMMILFPIVLTCAYILWLG